MTLALVFLSICIVILSPGFDYNSHWLDRPTFIYVGLMLCSTILYVGIVWPSLKNQPIQLSMKWIFCIGLLLRLIFIPSTPIWEDDFYRYFFDGALVKEGINPYQYAPIDTFEKPPIEGSAELGIKYESIPPALELNFLQEEELIDRVAYPHIKTIYPPVTQLFFGLSSSISTFNLLVWRLILLFVEITSFFLLISLLKHLNKPLSLVSIYWLNPLIITETINAAHMDALIVPFLVAVLIFIARKKLALAGVSLAFAVGIKLWPVLLAPLLFRPHLNSLPYLLKKSAPFALLSFVFLLPQLYSALDQQAGVANYAQHWQTNSFIFMWLNEALSRLSDYAFMPFYDPNIISRVTVAMIIIAILMKLMKNNWQSVDDLVQQWLVIVTSLFLLSPTGYPWYIVWFMPMLVIKPNKALLLLITLLPLYDLRYPLEAIGKQVLFDQVIVTFEFLPCLILLGMGYYKKVTQAKP